MTYRRSRLKSSQGSRFVVHWNIPKGRGPFPAVVLCHGFKGSARQLALETIATGLAKRGILCVRPDFPNNPKPNESGGDFFNLTFGQEYKDLLQVYRLILKDRRIDPKRIGISGHSLGGKLALYFAGGQSVKSIVSLAAVYDDTHTNRRFAQFKRQGRVDSTGKFAWIDVRGTPMKLSRRFYEDERKHPIRAKMKKITAPTLLIHGTADESVPVAEAQIALKTLAGKTKFVPLTGYLHNWRTQTQANRVAKLTVDWFVKTL